MSKILISTLPVSGHIRPALAVAKRLKAVGHEVVFAFPEGVTPSISSCFKCKITTNDKFCFQPTTLRFWPWYCSHDIKKIENNIRYILGDWTLTQLQRLREIAQEYSPDLIISDCLHVAPLIVAMERGIPSAALGVTPYRNLISGSAPVRSGIAPASNRQQAIIYDFINRAIQQRFYHVRTHLTKTFLQVSPVLLDTITRAPLSIFGICQDLSSAYLQCSSPCLEDSPIILEANGVEFIGPMNEDHLSPKRYLHKSAFNNAVGECKTKATIFITWGTVQPTPPHNFMKLAREFGRSGNHKIIIAPPNNQRAQVSKQLILECSESNVELTTDFNDFLPKLKTANVFVSNGGFGAVKAAISLGIPVVCFGNQDDKPDVCGRVNRSKVGIGFSLFINQRRIINAIRRVLREPSFTLKAQVVGKELAEYEESLRLERIVDRLLEKKVNKASQKV